MAVPVSFESQLEFFKLSDQQLSSLKTDGQALGIREHIFDRATNVIDVYHLLENERPDDVHSLIIEMLKNAGFSESRLEMLREYVKHIGDHVKYTDQRC